MKSILSGRIWAQYEEEGILKLEQKTLDEDIDQLEKEAAAKHPEERILLARVFEMLKNMMLRVCPNERRTIDQCITFLTSAKKIEHKTLYLNFFG